MKRTMIVLVLALATAATAGAVTAGKLVKIGAGSNGKTVRLNPGDTLQVRLAANPSTGYAWRVTSVGRSILKPSGSSYVPQRPVKPGSGGTAVLTFKAAKAGRTKLKLAYARTGGAPGKTFSVTIVVLLH